MYVVYDAILDEQIRSHRLAFTCEQCAHFCEDRRACAVMFPTDAHTDEVARQLQDGDRVFFCKMFEAR